MAQQIQIRRDTSTNWSSVNPILAQGELGLETNTGKVKIGNGSTAWNSLSYFGGVVALASLTDVNLTSLASGQVILSNGSSIFINKSLSSLIGELAFASLGSLAFIDQLSFTSLTNQPSLSSLAFQATLDYTSNQLLNKPSLGSLAPLNQLSFTSLTNQPSLSSLAFQSTVDYVTQVTSKPSLGSLAVLNSLTKSDVGLGNVTNDAQLKIASNLSDLNNIATARGNLSLGSLAVLNSVLAVLPSTASLDILYSNGIVNSSPVSTNLLSTNNILASTLSVGNITADNGAFNSIVSTNILTGNTILASTISTGILSVATLNYPALASQYLKTDLSNTPLTGTTLNFDSVADKNININRTTTAATAGRALNITAGGAVSGGTNQAGGALKLSSGIATGNSSSDIEFLTATAGTSGTADRNPTTKMIVKGNGRVGIGTTSPTVQLQVVGAGSFSGDLTSLNLSGTNTGDQLMPIYGDGADGYIVFDGFTTYLNIATLAGSTYTLLRDIYCSYFSVGSGVTVETAGYRIFSTSDITNDGIIRNNGANASGTTGGAGATGGFFRAGGAGTNGLGTASAGANGTAITANPASGTWIGGLGGRGGPARASNTTFLGSGYIPGNVNPPANGDGGPRIGSNYINYLNKLVSASTPYQISASAGGGAGAKSATGTNAVSGGGGGGGGIVFIAAPNIYGAGTIEANGGTGGNASGTGGTFGGGGGGGGGIVTLVAKTSNVTATANGSSGGTSVRLGTNPDSPVGANQVNGTTTATSVSFTPSVCPSEYSLLMLSANIQKTGGVSNCYITSVTGYGMNWTLVSGSRVEYSTIASPTRAIEVWAGTYNTLSADIPADKTITVYFSEAPTNSRIFIDEIFNTDIIDNTYPVTSNYQTNRSDSATSLSMVLGTAPSATNGVYTFVGRSGGTVAASTTGTIMGTNDTATSAGATMLGLGTTTNTMTQTGAAAVAGFSVEINKPSATQTRGSAGWNGKVIRIYG